MINCLEKTKKPVRILSYVGNNVVFRPQFHTRCVVNEISLQNVCNVNDAFRMSSCKLSTYQGAQ